MEANNCMCGRTPKVVQPQRIENKDGHPHPAITQGWIECECGWSWRPANRLTPMDAVVSYWNSVMGKKGER